MQISVLFSFGQIGSTSRCEFNVISELICRCNSIILKCSFLSVIYLWLFQIFMVNLACFLLLWNLTKQNFIEACYKSETFLPEMLGTKKKNKNLEVKKLTEWGTGQFVLYHSKDTLCLVVSLWINGWLLIPCETEQSGH